MRYGVRLTVQPANSRPEIPGQDPNTWKWQGFLPNVASPGDEDHYSLLSHLRHLLARDPTLRANMLPGGLVLWLTQNVSKIEEWAGSAQGDWHDVQTSSGNVDQIHRHSLRILEYLDGAFYYRSSLLFRRRRGKCVKRARRRLGGVFITQPHPVPIA